MELEQMAATDLSHSERIAESRRWIEQSVDGLRVDLDLLEEGLPLADYEQRREVLDRIMTVCRGLDSGLLWEAARLRDRLLEYFIDVFAMGGCGDE